MPRPAPETEAGFFTFQKDKIMAKIKLGARPKNFTASVKFAMLDGSEGVINVTYKYRTRTEFGAFLDEVYAENGVAKPVDGDGQSNLVEMAYANGNGKIADQIMRAAEGWDLDEPFTDENIQALVNELPAAAGAIIATYERAVKDGVLGN